MELKPGYKQTEVGVIPEDWDVKSVANLVGISSPICYGVVQVGQNTENGVPIVAIKYVKEIAKAKLHQTSEALERPYSRSRVRGGDVLISIKGTIGRVGIVPSGFQGNISRELARLRVEEGYSPEYIAHQLEADCTQERIFRSVVGTTRLEFSIAALRQFQLPIPPAIDEQQAIATALSDADALIEALEQLLAKKRQIKQGAMQELLTGQRRLPGFKGMWEEKALGDLFDFSGGITASREQLGTAGYSYLHYGDIHISDRTHIDVNRELHELPKLDVPLKKVSKASLLEDGDVVFVDASEDDDGTSKHVVIVNPDGIPYISGLHTIVAKSVSNELDNLYKRYVFQTRAVKAQFRFFAVGTKVSGISKTNIGKITVFIPTDPVEQNAIAAVLSDMDADIATLETKLAKARSVKQGMMQELLTGRIRLA